MHLDSTKFKRTAKRIGKTSLKTIATVIALVLTAGCQNPAVSLCECPHVKNWTSLEQHDLLESEKKLPPESPLIDALIDYKRLRNEAKACQL